MNTRPDITPPSEAHCAGHLIQKNNNNKKDFIHRLDYHHTQPCPSEENQTTKNSAQILPYVKLTQTTGPTLEGRNQKEERIQP